MKTVFRPAIAATMMAALGLTGCTTAGGGAPSLGSVHLTTAVGGDSALASATDDFDRTVVEGALVGALVGAAAGGMAGNWKPQAMLTGAAIGAGAGLLAGYAVAGQKRSYTRREDALDAMIADGRDRVAKASRVAERAEALVAIRRAEVARLKSAGAAEKARAETANAIEADRDNLRRAIAAAQGNARDLDGNATAFSEQFGATAGGLDEARGQLRDREARLRRADERLAEIGREIGR